MLYVHVDGTLERAVEPTPRSVMGRRPPDGLQMKATVGLNEPAATEPEIFNLKSSI